MSYPGQLFPRNKTVCINVTNYPWSSLLPAFANVIYYGFLLFWEWSLTAAQLAVPSETHITTASEVTRRILTNGIGVTVVLFIHTFVSIVALQSIPFIPVVTFALKWSSDVAALCVCMTVVGALTALVDIVASKSVACIARHTLTPVWPVRIRAHSSGMTAVSFYGTLIQVGTVLSVSCKPSLAMAIKRTVVVSTCSVFVTISQTNIAFINVLAPPLPKTVKAGLAKANKRARVVPTEFVFFKMAIVNFLRAFINISALHATIPLIAFTGVWPRYVFTLAHHWAVMEP